MPELQFDTNRTLKQETGLIPEGTVPGYRLTYVGPGPTDFDWVQDADSEILKGVGDPNGVVFASKTTLYVERGAPALWINNDGQAGWELVGSTTASGFPVGPYDDGFATHEIQTQTVAGTSSAAVISTALDATPTDIAHIATAVLAGAVSATLHGITDDGSEATVIASVIDGATADVQMTSAAVGASNPAQFTAHTATSGGSSATVYAASVEINGVTDTRIISPVVSFNGQLTSPTILSASEFAFWLDDTPGATVLNIKAKDSGGTIRTASIALA